MSRFKTPHGNTLSQSACEFHIMFSSLFPISWVIRDSMGPGLEPVGQPQSGSEPFCHLRQAARPCQRSGGSQRYSASLWGGKWWSPSSTLVLLPHNVGATSRQPWWLKLLQARRLHLQFWLPSTLLLSLAHTQPCLVLSIIFFHSLSID